MIYNKILVYLTHPHVDVWNFKPEHKTLLQSLLLGVTVEVCANSKEFKDKLSEAEVVIAWVFKEEWLQNAPKLKLIATPAAGNDWIPWQPPANLKLSFGGFHGPMIAETVIGAMLHFLKAFPLSTKMQKKNRWARIKVSKKQQSLYKARVTILGFGKIGNALGRLLKPFGCKITGIKRTAIPAPDYFDEEDKIIIHDKWEFVLPETDHLICALPAGSETYEILQPIHFKNMRKTSFFYNVGRGNIYKETDLVEALQGGEI